MTRNTDIVQCDSLTFRTIAATFLIALNIGLIPGCNNNAGKQGGINISGKGTATESFYIDTLSGKAGRYFIDLPEEISQSKGKDLTAKKSGDSILVSFDNRQILKMITDKRGLISFTFKEGEDTLGLDYLTVKGFNHWLRGEIDSVYNDTDPETVSAITIDKGMFTIRSDKAKSYIWVKPGTTRKEVSEIYSYNIDNNLMWSTDSIYLARVTIKTIGGAEGMFYIPYKPYGICCNDSTEIKIKQHNQ